MWSAPPLLCVVLLAAVAAAGPPNTADLETFEPEPRVFTVLDLLTAVNSRLRQQDADLAELRQQQTALTARLEDVLRRLPEYPTCEVVTTEEEGRQFRLVGDPGCSRGRLQWRIKGYGQWHQLCDRSEWTAEDAAVACLSLGFRASEPGVDGELVGSADHGYARGLIIRCGGWEEHLWQCELEAESRHTDGCRPTPHPSPSPAATASPPANRYDEGYGQPTPVVSRRTPDDDQRPPIASQRPTKNYQRPPRRHSAMCTD